MALKQNTLKVLLTLLATERANGSGLTGQNIKSLLQDITTTGARSLLVLLERKKLIYKRKVFGATTFHIAELGLHALKTAFPALQSDWRTWNGSWTVIAFLDAPSGDAQFRYLRKLLTSHYAMPLSRGIYAKAGNFSPEVTVQLQNVYLGHVIIFSVSEWIQGFDKPVVFEYYDLPDKATDLSGISNDSIRLLDIISSSNRLNNQQKNNLITLVDRYIDFLRSDPGFVHYYFPGLPDKEKILMNIGKILCLWD